MGADERKDFIFRTGTFFVLVGIVVMVLFGAPLFISSEPPAENPSPVQLDGQTQQDENPFSVMPCLGGLVVFGFGLYLKRLAAPPRPASGRFSGLRKLLDKRKKK
jgi:drug/metabolite transporter (DMT)-like permease